MRKLITMWLLLISSLSFAQTWEGGLGNTLQRTPTIKGYNYRFNMGSGKGVLNIYSKERIDSLLLLVGPVPDSVLRPNKNLYDVPDKTVARNNLGITTLLALKSNDNAVVHLAGTETITGFKTTSAAITATSDNTNYYGSVLNSTYNASGHTGTNFYDLYTNGSVRVHGGLIADGGLTGSLRSNSITRNTNTTQFSFITPGDASLLYQVGFTSGGGTVTGQSRVYSANTRGLISMGDSVIVATGTPDYSTISFNGQLNSSAVGTYSSLKDGMTVTAGDFAFIRSARDLSTGYFIKSTGTAPSAFGGDIEVTTIGKGIIWKSPDGTRYRITIANGGTLTITAL